MIMILIIFVKLNGRIYTTLKQAKGDFGLNLNFYNDHRAKGDCTLIVNVDFTTAEHLS